MNLVRIYFLTSAVILIVIAIFSNALYDLGTHCARRWGWTRIVRVRERMRYWALPFSQILLVFLAVGCLIAVVFL